MGKYKAKTLRRLRKPVIYKGGQQNSVDNKNGVFSMDYKDNFDFFLDSTKELKEEKNKLYTSGNKLYAQETEDKYKIINNDIIVKFNEELVLKVNNLEIQITELLDNDKSDYASYFLQNMTDLQDLLNESSDLLVFSTNIQKEINNKNFHIHLIPTYVNLYESLKPHINSLQEKYELVKSDITKNIEKVNEEYDKKKPYDPNDFEYIALLNKEDASVFGVKYVKGDLIYENNNPKQFIPNNKFLKNVTDLSNNEGYYLSSDNNIHKVKISPIPPPVIRKVQSQQLYFSLLNDKDQVLTGVQYVYCNKDGSILLENDKPVPFFPMLHELNMDAKNFNKLAPNKVDIIQYNYVRQYSESYPALYVINEAVFKTLVNPMYSNLIEPFYKNKYIEINTDTYLAPFTLPKFLVESGDYFLICNISKLPIVFNISKNSDEKRVIVYPNQIICFVYSEKSNIISYGFLLYKKNNFTETESNLVAKINNTNTYVFMISNNTKELIPLLDTQNDIICVPNFDLSGSKYYDYDDYFQKKPIKVNIVNPIQVENPSYSKEFISPISPYVCLTKFDIFVYCDENGIPVLDTFGYFVPVLTPIHYSQNMYFYYLEDKKRYITLKDKYDGVSNFDNGYDILFQNATPYSITYNNTKIFTDSFGNPIIYNKTKFAKIPNGYTTRLLTNIIDETFETQEYNLEERRQYISLYHLHNILEIYRSNTTSVYEHYKDLSGNMNNFGSLLMDFQLLDSSLETKKDINLFQDIETIFTKVKDTYNKLSNVTKIKEKELETLKKINELKLLRLDDISPLLTKIDQMKSKILGLEELDDINFLNKTLNKIDTTTNVLKDNLQVQTGGGDAKKGGVETIDFLKNQSKSIEILKTSLDILEKNYNSSLKATKVKKEKEDEEILKKNGETLLSMEKRILDAQYTIDDMSTRMEYYMSAVPMDHEDEFNKYNETVRTNIKTIQSIINAVKPSESFETPKQYNSKNIPSLISERDANIQLLEKTKANINNLFTKMDDIIKESEKNELNQLKKDIMNIILEFETQHNTINILNNKLKLKQYYEIEPNNIEVQQLKNTIASQNDKDTLKANYRQIYNVYLTEKDILDQLQTKEIVGGGTKKKTRKSRKIRYK